MSDICKCEGTGCPFRDSCYRFTAEANPYRQSYFMEVPLKWLDASYKLPVIPHCEEYWEYPRVVDSKGTNPKKEKK